MSVCRRLDWLNGSNAYRYLTPDQCVDPYVLKYMCSRDGVGAKGAVTGALSKISSFTKNDLLVCAGAVGFALSRVRIVSGMSWLCY